MFDRSAPIFLVYGGGIAVSAGILIAWGADLAAMLVLNYTSSLHLTTTALVLLGTASTLAVQGFLLVGWRRFLRSQSLRARRMLAPEPESWEGSRATPPADRRTQEEPASGGR